MKISGQIFIILLFSFLSGIIWNAFYPKKLPYFLEDPVLYLFSREYPEIPLLDLTGAFSMFKKGALFADARSEEEFLKGHIKGALNIPYEDFSVNPLYYINYLPLNKPIIIYCEGGTCDLSFSLAKELKTAGFEDIYVYYEGYERWVKKGLPLEK